MPRLTDTRLRSLKTTGQRYVMWDQGGFAVRVGSHGKKSFVYAYREGKRVRWLTLGSYPAMSLADARAEHALAAKAHGAGESPARTKLAEKRRALSDPTFEDLINYYIERYAQRQKVSWEEDRRLLKRDALPLWCALKAREITRRDVIDLLDDVADRAPVTANRLRAVLMRMFNFAVEREILTTSPCVKIKAPTNEISRGRWLDEPEILAVWMSLAIKETSGAENAERLRMDLGNRLAMKLLLATGQRPSEILSIERSEINTQEAIWVIPKSKTKTKNHDHIVPLSPQALAVLKEINALSSQYTWLLPSPTGNGPLHHWGLSHAVKRNLSVFGIPVFTPHDLRRSVRTWLGKLGIPPHIAERVINHSQGKMEKTYDVYGYLHEKRAALDTWGHKLEAIVTGAKDDNVMPLIRLA